MVKQRDGQIARSHYFFLQFFFLFILRLERYIIRFFEKICLSSLVFIAFSASASGSGVF